MICTYFPTRVFLDSSIIQTLHVYGEFIFENAEVKEDDPIFLDSKGIEKLECLRKIMQCMQRTPFEFALSTNSIKEALRKNDPGYMPWVYELIDYWLINYERSKNKKYCKNKMSILMSNSFNYLSSGDRELIIDAVNLDCDSFLTMENKLPRNSHHLEHKLLIRVLTPITFWENFRTYADLYK